MDNIYSFNCRLYCITCESGAKRSTAMRRSVASAGSVHSNVQTHFHSITNCPAPSTQYPAHQNQCYTFSWPTTTIIIKFFQLNYVFNIINYIDSILYEKWKNKRFKKKEKKITKELFLMKTKFRTLFLWDTQLKFVFGL